MVATQDVEGQEALLEGPEPFTRAEKALGVAVNSVVLMPLDWLVEDPGNERQALDDGIEEMRDSIREGGIREPLVAYRVGPNKYMLMGGHRRRRGAELEGLNSVYVLVRAKPATEAQKAIDRLVSNLQRKDLSAIEKARGFQAVLKGSPDMTQSDLARQLGISQPQVANTLRLLNLPGEVLKVVEEHGLPAGAAAALLRITDDEIDYGGKTTRTALQVQAAFANRAANEGWSVHSVEKVIETHLREQKRTHEYVESERKRRAAESLRASQQKAQQEARQAATEGKPAPPPLSAEELVKQQRSQAFFQGRARTSRVKVAHAALRHATALDPKGGPSLDHLKLAALMLIASSGYSYNSDGADLWELPAKEALKKSVIEASSKTEVLTILSQYALSLLSIDYNGRHVSTYSDVSKFANEAWAINNAITAALMEADLLDADGKEIIPGPKAKGKKSGAKAS